MSEDKTDKKTSAVNDISASSMAEFLNAQPNFFRQHPQLVEKLALKHEHPEGTASLIEYQNRLYKRQIIKLTTQLNEFISLANNNEQLMKNVFTQTERALACEHMDDLIDLCENQIKQDFQADFVKFYFNDALNEHAEIINQNANATESQTIICAPTDRTLLQPLLNDDSLLSLCSIPIKNHGDATPTAMLILASRNATRFNLDMDTTLLSHLGRIIEISYQRLQQQH